MDKNLVLQDNDGKVVRVFNWNGEDAKVIRRSDTKRLELAKELQFFFDNNIAFEEMGQVSGDAFTSIQNIKSQNLKIGHLGQLALVPSVTTHYKNESNKKEKNRLWMLSILLVFLLFLGAVFLSRIAPETSPKIEADLKQQVVKIVKNIKRETPVVQPRVAPSEEKIQPTAKVSPTKISGLKRMGALSVLGSLSKGKNKGGLDISAAQSTGGPGMGGTEGSGGVQTSLYAKGIVGAALGAGHNVNGGGGYGTKGKGGGQAGYGKMALTGSTGARPMPLTNEATVASGLDRDQIAAVINRNIGQVTNCYEQGLADNAGLNGRVAIAFVIGSTGLVQSAGVDSSTVGSKVVENCIVMRVKTWKFPVPEGGVNVDVSYPFLLNRAGQG